MINENTKAAKIQYPPYISICDLTIVSFSLFGYSKVSQSGFCHIQPGWIKKIVAFFALFNDIARDAKGLVLGATLTLDYF